VGHAVAGKNENNGIVVNLGQYLPEDLVNGDINIAHRITDDGYCAGVVTWVARIMKMPALMPDTMAFAKDLAKKIPPALH
jgi:hypothetical protein